MDDLFPTARPALTHVCWLGGPGCSGKSSVARIVGGELDMYVYEVDAEMQNQESDPSLVPEKWQGIDFYGKTGKPLMYLPSEDAANCVTDNWQTSIFVGTVRRLLTLPSDQGIIVDGTFLPKTLLQVTDRERCAFMVSKRPFREEHWAHRSNWYAAYEDKALAYRTALDALDYMDRLWLKQANAFGTHIHSIASLQDLHVVSAQLIDRFLAVTQT